MRVCVCAPQNETLDMFQREWYRLQGEGKLSDMDMGTVPDIYLRNQQLGERQPSPHAALASTDPTPPHLTPPHPSPSRPAHTTRRPRPLRFVPQRSLTDPLVCCCAQPTS